jgi:hypothetical protein
MDDRSWFTFIIKSLLSCCGPVKRCGLSLHARAVVVVCLATCADPSQSSCQVACKPIITVKSIRVSAVQEMQRTWTAVLVVDGQHCATSSGRFEVDFIRLKENGPDLQFTLPFTWRPGEIAVSVDLWWDETVHEYRIGFIAPCVCRDPL